MRKLVVFCTVLVLLFGGLTASVWAQSHTGNFWIGFNPTIPTPSEGAGPNDGWDGWDSPVTGGHWQYYPNGPLGPFWNQWWYDDPLDMDRRKEIFYDVTIQSDDAVANGDSAIVTIALNWSNASFLPQTGQGGPPPGPQEEDRIERSIIFSEEVVSGQTVNFDNATEVFKIDEYNPEWVSMDVWVEYNGSAGNFIAISGTIEHECVPEPTTIVLLCIGAFGLLLHARRRR